MNRREFLISTAFLIGSTVLPIPSQVKKEIWEVDVKTGECELDLTLEMFERALKYFENCEPQPTYMMFSYDDAEVIRELMRVRI